MRSALFWGTFFIGISAASGSSELDAGTGAFPEELQRLEAELLGNDGNQLESNDALEELQEAPGASQEFANPDFQAFDIGNGILPYDGESSEPQSAESTEDVQGRSLGKKTEFLGPLPPPKKVVVQVPAKNATPVAVYRKLQVDSSSTRSADSEEEDQELHNDLREWNADEDKADERTEVSEELDPHSEANEREAEIGDILDTDATGSAGAEDLEDGNGVTGTDGWLPDTEFENVDLATPDDESDEPMEGDSEGERNLGKKRYYYAVPKKAQPPPKKVTVAPKKALAVMAPKKVHEKKVLPPPKKYHHKKTVPIPKKVVRPAKKYVPVQKKAPPPKKVYAPPPKKVYAPPPKKVNVPPPKKVYAPMYVPVSKKGGYRL